MRLCKAGWLFPVLCCLLALAKLALVANNEIITAPYDSEIYARQSVELWKLGIQPGYPIWLSLCSLFAVPQRLAIEGLYLVAALFVAVTGRRYFGFAAGLAIFALLALAPFTYFLFDNALSDGFFTCLTLLALGMTIRLFFAPTTLGITGWASGVGITLGVMAITRNEDPLLAIWVFLCVGISAFLWRPAGASIFKFDSWRKPLMAGSITAAAACLLVLAIFVTYYFSDGVAARSLVSLPGHTRLLGNLARIETGEAPMRYVPISRKSRELAYGVSPALANLRSAVEDPRSIHQLVSRESGLPNGEIGAGWIWHAINSRNSLFSNGNSATAEAEYNKINAEIEAAFDDGRLKRRFIIHPLIGGDLAGLLMNLPHSISSVVASAFGAAPYQRDRDHEAQLFDRVFFRRAALIGNELMMRVQGWAFVDRPGGRITSVLVGSPLAIHERIQTMARPDVVKVYSAEKGWKPDVVGYSADVKSRLPDDVTVTYFLDSGNHVQGDHLREMHVSTLGNQDPRGGAVIQGIDMVRPHPDARAGARHEIQLALVRFSQSTALHWGAAAVCALALIVIGRAVRRERDSRWKGLVAFFGFTLLVWCARILFYSVIDAAAWQVGLRYLVSAHALGVVLFSVSFAVLAVFTRDSVFGLRANTQ